MRYILNRRRFINEELLRDEISDLHKSRVANLWGEDYLDYETLSSTDRIKKGKWKLSDEDSESIINKTFNTNIDLLIEKLSSIPEKFENDLKLAFDLSKFDDEISSRSIYRLKGCFDGDWSMDSLTFYQISAMYLNIFRKISVSESKSDQMIQRDESGKPIMGEDNKPIKVSKEPGQLVFSNNMTSISSFISDWNSVNENDKIDVTFRESFFQNIYSIFNDNNRIGDFPILNGDSVYLYISDKPQDILNMSVSPFYTSCQEFFTGGGHDLDYVGALLSNVFDPNSVPAFLIIDTPYIASPYPNDDASRVEKLSDFMALSRLLIRNIDDSDGSGGLYFDDSYPSRMSGITKEIIRKYSDNSDDYDSVDTYIFKPNLDICDIGSKKPGALIKLKEPYMDNLRMETKSVLNVNVRKIIFDGNFDNDINIKVESKLKEVSIQSHNVPDSFFESDINIECLKIEFIKINTFEKFKSLKSETLIINKCMVVNSVWKSFPKSLNSIKKLVIRSIDTDKRVSPIEFGNMKNLEELDLVYSFKEINKSLLKSNSLKVLRVSGDMLRSEKNKLILNELKSKGVKIETIGLSV